MSRINSDILAAKADRAAYYAPPSRGFQMGLALLDAASKNQQHPLSSQIGRCAQRLAK